MALLILAGIFLALPWHGVSAWDSELMPLPVGYQSFQYQSPLSFDYFSPGTAPTTTNWNIIHSNGLTNTSTKLQLADGTTAGKTVLSSTNVKSLLFIQLIFFLH